MQIEQPPEGTDDKLKEYLSRMFINVDLALSNRDQLKKCSVLPDKPSIGKVYYFTQVIGATITAEGYWGYTSSGWVQLG